MTKKNTDKNGTRRGVAGEGACTDGPADGLDGVDGYDGWMDGVDSLPRAGRARRSMVDQQYAA